MCGDHPGMVGQSTVDARHNPAREPMRRFAKTPIMACLAGGSGNAESITLGSLKC